jgi:iron(III) transport system substrate-binding protein
MLAAIHAGAWKFPSYGVVALLLTLSLVGCAPPAAQAPVKATPTTPAVTSQSPAGASAGDWEQTLAAAKREGKLVITSQPSDSYRLPLMSFEEDYPDIKVEYIGLTAPNFWPRLNQERAAGQYLWDLRIGGPDPTVFRARDEGVLDPLRPVLMLPEVLDDSRWLEGLDGLFSDLGKEYVITFFAAESVTQFVNRDILPDRELPSSRELLDPKFKGKVAMGDPRGGPGLGQSTLLLVAYGDDYLASLMSKQDTVYTQDLRQLAEWIVRGRYPVAIGLPKYHLEPFHEQGLGRNIKPLPGPLGLTNAGGGIQLLNRAPHPNAAKVYVNWLLTPKAQAAIAKATLFNSRRLDVPPGDPNAIVDPTRINEYVPYQHEKLMPARARAEQLGKELLP